MIATRRAEDIVYSNLFTGVHGNYLRGSIVNAGSIPISCRTATKRRWTSAPATKAKAWRDIWGAGQGVGQIQEAPPAGEIVERLASMGHSWDGWPTDELPGARSLR